MDVMKGLSFDKTPPSVIMCEFQDQVTTARGYNFHDTCQYVTDRGYNVFVSEWFPVTDPRGFVWRGLNRYPCDLADNNAFGDIICARDPAIFEQLYLAYQNLAIAGYFIRMAGRK